MAEVRTSSYNHVVQTPRIGGCTGAFFNLFDWNQSKRFASTKRLPAERPDKVLRRSKSFRDDRSAGVVRGCSPSPRTLSHERDREIVSEDEASSKPPGLVARLMGLESLPEAPVSSKHRRSRSFSGSESASRSENDSRGEKLALRDLLKQEHESFENFCSGEIVVLPHVEYMNQQKRRVRKVAAVQTPIKSLVPYVDSPTGSCRSVYALPYVHKGDSKSSPFLARLHPSPVLQPSKCHNQNVSPAKSSPATKKRASRFLEAAVKILEEISDNEQCFPREREGMRSIAEFAASSPASSGTDLLHCRSMSKIWNGSEDTDSVGSRSNRSLTSRGSMSFRDSQRRDRICRDIFETSLSERAQSVSPPPRRPRTKGAVTPKEVQGRGILRTQEAAIVDFKTDVRNASPKVSSHDGLRPIKLARNGGGQEENAAAVSSSRVLSTEFAKPRNASTPSHGRQFTGQMDELKLSVRVKREKQVRAPAAESSPPAVQCHSPLPSASPLKRSRRKSRHGSPKLRESSGVSRGGERRTPPRPNLHGERRKSHNVEARTPPRNISTRGKDVGKSSAEEVPLRIMDDVSPDVALPGSRNDGHEVEVVDVNLGTRDEEQYETGHGDVKLEHVQGAARGLFPCPEVAESSNFDEMVVLGMDDLHWDDGMVEQQRENSSRARYCEIRASGESLQSICGALGEDVCNVDNGVDDGSSPSPQEFVGECSEADVHDESSTPILMKRILGKPLSLDVDLGETSPVSVLESPFADEVCTTSECNVAGANFEEPERQQADNALEHTHGLAMEVTEVVADLERESEVEVVFTPPSGPTPLDKVKQALLDISSFRSFIQGASESTQASPQTEKSFVREVLSAAQLLSSPGRSPNWYERDLAVDPSLFEKLEGGDTTPVEDGDFLCESGGMWRCDRKLLFDCVNEAFSQNARHFKDPQPWLRRPMLRTRSVRHKLVEEVQEKINGWRELASHAIDTLIDIDMSTRVGKWTDFSEEVAEVGAEIECMVWQVMVDEVVLELAESLH